MQDECGANTMPDVPSVDVFRMPYGSELKSILKGLHIYPFLYFMKLFIVVEFQEFGI